MVMTMMRKSACRCRVSALQGRAGSALATWAPPAAGTGRCDREEEEEEGGGVSALPAPQVDGGSSPSERLLTKNAGNSRCPQPAQNLTGLGESKVRCERGQKRRLGENVRVIFCVRMV